MNSELMQAFDFTEEDLMFNKTGKLSSRQAGRYKRSDTRAKVFGFFVMLGSGAGTFFTLRPFFLEGLSISDHLGRFIGGVVLAGLALFFLYALFEKSEPVILSAQGPAQFVIRKIRSSDQGSYSTRYYVVLGGHEIDVGKDKYPVFKQGYIYAIYQEPSIGILSVEYIGPPAE